MLTRRSFIQAITAGLGVLGFARPAQAKTKIKTVEWAENITPSRYMFNSRTGCEGRCACELTFNGVPVTCDYHRALGVRYLGTISSL